MRGCCEPHDLRLPGRHLDAPLDRLGTLRADDERVGTTRQCEPAVAEILCAEPEAAVEVDRGAVRYAAQLNQPVIRLARLFGLILFVLRWRFLGHRPPRFRLLGRIRVRRRRWVRGGVGVRVVRIWVVVGHYEGRPSKEEVRSEAAVDDDGSAKGMSPVEGAASEATTPKAAHRPGLGPRGQRENGAG